MIKCCVCGKFLAHEEMVAGGGAKFEYTPLSDRSEEQCDWICKHCADLYMLRPDEAACK